MAVSPFLLFIRKNGKSASLPKDIAARGKALGKLYKALPAAEKAALVKAAKATPAPKHTKIRPSVRIYARSKKVPIAVVKKLWKSTNGSTTACRIKRIAKKIAPKSTVKAAAKQVVKAAKKPVAAVEKVAAKKPVAKKPVAAVEKVAAKKPVAKKAIAKKVSKK